MIKKNKNPNYKLVMDYCKQVTSGAKKVNKEQREGVERFLRALKDKRYDFRPEESEKLIKIIEKTIVHRQGESLDGRSMLGRPFLLQPFQKFLIYDLLGFWKKGTNERRFKESFIFIPRKNSKTTFASSLAWGLSLYNMGSGAKCYIIANAMQQARESFDFIKFNINRLGETKAFKILDSNAERSIERQFESGSIRIQALASSTDRQDSLNCNIAIADELHVYKTDKQYTIIKEAMKAYTNKLMIGITTAGDNMNSFCYKRLQYCKKVLAGLIEDEQYHIFIAKADESEEGDVDYTNPIEHEKANPMYGITIRPDEMLNDSLQAMNDPQSRKNFLAKSLNIYTSSTRSYFNLDKFRVSDSKYNWTLEDLIKLKIEWFGGADLSKMHDLTATALVGEYKGVLIIITHAFFPITRAYLKAEEDNIPLFGWKDDGNLTMSNDDVVNYDEVVRWFITMRDKGFNIKQIGFDRKFAEEFYLKMKKHYFSVIDEPQLYINKTKGFRRIEQKMLSKELYYMHSEAYEYCVENVHAIEKTDDMIQYEKVQPTMRIDLFDASVFATVRLIHDLGKKEMLDNYLKK
ncbi:MAG: terminase large subunit [Tissierellia bacterium]|nr:terminase large subunit [Tissierellia bacterium]